jgi:hypothetical protein
VVTSKDAVPSTRTQHLSTAGQFRSTIQVVIKRSNRGSGTLSGYIRALLAALMIVFGLLIFTIALAGVIGPPN